LHNNEALGFIRRFFHPERAIKFQLREGDFELERGQGKGGGTPIGEREKEHQREF